MRNPNELSLIKLPTAPPTMTAAMNVEKNKEWAILEHESRYCFT